LRFDGEQWNYLFSQFQLPEETGKSTIGAILGLILGLCVAARLVGKNESVLNLFAYLSRLHCRSRDLPACQQDVVMDK
jgi:hypothetical protein